MADSTNTLRDRRYITGQSTSLDPSTSQSPLLRLRVTWPVHRAVEVSRARATHRREEEREGGRLTGRLAARPRPHPTGHQHPDSQHRLGHHAPLSLGLRDPGRFCQLQLVSPLHLQLQRGVHLLGVSSATAQSCAVHFYLQTTLCHRPGALAA